MTPAQKPPPSSPACMPPQPTPVPASALLRGGTCVLIEHQGQIYRLQSTRAGKLILTK